jgi:uncharacterized membrane protein
MSAEAAAAFARRTRVAVLTLCALLGVLVAWAALRATSWPASALLALVLLLPLLAPLPGLIRGRRRTYAWATMSVIPYFMYGIVEVIATPSSRVTSGSILFATLALFIALIAFLRATRAPAA